MKFNVKKTDFIIFLIFCAFLLYLSAVAVLNVTSLLESGTFYGGSFFISLIPLRAFLPPYLGPTLLIFTVFLIAVFLSVKSYIFGRDKKSSGFGLSWSKKKSDGYAKWADEKEIKNAPKVSKVLISDKSSKAGGVTLLNDGTEMWVDTGENHSIVIGATASGKTTAIVNPLVMNLAKAGESIVLTDPKAELYEEHANMLKDYGYDVIVLNFREPEKGNAWNPLTLPHTLYKQKNYDKSKELLEDVAQNIIYEEQGDDNPFWENSAADYFSGLALGLFEDAEEDAVNLNSINYMSTIGEESHGIQSNFIKSYFESKGKDSTPYVFASATINTVEATKSGILSVFRQKIRQFSTGGALSEMLSYSDFDMKDIGKRKTAVFLVVHDEKKTYHSLATIFIKQCYEALIDVAQENGGKLKYRTNFILDEFANMPPLKDVTTMVTAARSRHIRFNFIIQNFAQLNQVYGRENAETIRSNCGNLIYLITTELAALEELSKLFGEVKVKGKDGKPDSVKPLISISDLQKLKLNEVIILRARLSPFKTKLTPSYEIDWGVKHPKAEFNVRPKKEVKLFDIKEHVITTKREQMFAAQEKNIDADKPRIRSEIISEKKPTIIDGFNPLNQPVPNLDEILSEATSKYPVSNREMKEVEELLSSTQSTDELLAKIDKRIEELTKEIEMENMEQSAPVKPTRKKVKTTEKPKVDYDILEQTIYDNFDDFLTSNDDVGETTEILVDDNIKEIKNSDTTDDQYFDDFF